ncbi:hypothetical protein Tco_1455957 [Tanacetum coccineum]
MTTLAEHMIVAGADNRPPMLEKSMYNSWQSHMLLYIKGKEHNIMMLNSVLNGPLVYPTIEVDGVTRLKTYEELPKKEKLQDDCDLRAMNIVLQGLPLDIYALVNHNQPEWSKFVTDVKLAKSMYTTNYDQLYAYLSQHEGHANEVCLMRERYPDPIALIANHHHISSYPHNNSQYNTSQYQQQLSVTSPQTYNPQLQSQSYQAPHHQQQY